MHRIITLASTETGYTNLSHLESDVIEVNMGEKTWSDRVSQARIKKRYYT